LVFSLVYLISPIDLIPDFVVPIIGQLDDIAILYLALRYFFTSIPHAVLEEHMAAIQKGE
ncbi:MAG TPA: DUF1232 domain-containing protein, partial [Bacteroidetes bacterium]|nr:DUF1232 domain-containing protein [Bacteroidota bacterium]